MLEDGSQNSWHDCWCKGVSHPWGCTGLGIAEDFSSYYQRNELIAGVYDVGNGNIATIVLIAKKANFCGLPYKSMAMKPAGYGGRSCKGC
jgi:hypothetical protein